MSILRDPVLEALLAKLHAASDAQFVPMVKYWEDRSKQPPRSVAEEAAENKRFFSDKLVALDRDKGEFCYQLCRALGARRIVEIGTSHGVSTLYLAAAIRDNCRADAGRGEVGVVIGTEYEPEKARVARAHFQAAGLEKFTDLREGDLRQTLLDLRGPIDFLLVDIWIEMALPALKLVAPHLRRGAIVLSDNTARFRDAYAEYLGFLQNPVNGFTTMTLPFAGGLEMSVRS